MKKYIDDGYLLHLRVVNSILLLAFDCFSSLIKLLLFLLWFAAIEVAHHEVAVNSAIADGVADAHQEDLVLVIGPLEDMFP